jgi:hypothetical protein
MPKGPQGQKDKDSALMIFPITRVSVLGSILLCAGVAFIAAKPHWISGWLFASAGLLFVVLALRAKKTGCIDASFWEKDR